MHPFTYVESGSPESAVQAVAKSNGAVFYAGGTTLLDLMKLDVMTPSELVSVNHLPFADIKVSGGEVVIGANVRNSDLAHHHFIREHFPVLSEALLAGASAQLRNMASTVRNILQKTRCGYYRNVNSRCNKREPGSGCDAFGGHNRDHAVLGTSSHCIATHHSDMCVALAMLDSTVETIKADGSKRSIPFIDLHCVPGDTPEIETVLESGELITHIRLRALPMARNSHYLKVRDRSSYEFALASAGVAWELDGELIVHARVGLGGIATKPWRSLEAEAALRGKPARVESYQAAAEAALAGAVTQSDNAFKVELAKRTLVAALETLRERKA